MKPILAFLFFSSPLLGLYLSAQVAINTDGSSAHPSAMLEVKSTDKGFLPPRINEAQMNAINNPGFGLMVMCIDCKPKGPYYFDGSNWVNFSTAVPSGMNFSDVFNPTTGKTWMDRNLGASQVATSINDAASYGDLYQWGRGADGHESRISNTRSEVSNSDTPGHGDFITNVSFPYDWRYPLNDNLWQGVNGTNNPCPNGYRLPTAAEWEAERTSWSSNDAVGAFASPLKLPLAGSRYGNNGSPGDVGSFGIYWSSTVDGIYARHLIFNSIGGGTNSNERAYGYSVRCIKD